MLQFEAVGFTEGFERADLIEAVGVLFVRRTLHVPASEADEVGISGVRAGRHSLFGAGLERLFHHQRVAGVKAAGDVRRGHGAHYRRVVAHFVGAEALSDIAVKVYFVHGRSLLFYISSQVISYVFPFSVILKRPDMGGCAV